MAIDKKIKYDIQGGVKNYLGKQKEVKAPLKWQSSPDHPTTELAYITKKEKDLLVKSDLHGSLKGGVNRGPSGIMSLNGWGDAPSESSGTSSSGGGGNNFNDYSYGGAERYDTPVGGYRVGQGPPDTGALGTSGLRSNVDVVNQKYSGDGFFSGYRNLDARGQPKMGLSYLGDRLKNFAPTVMGAFMGNPWIGTGFNAVKSFGKHGTLADWWSDRQNWSDDGDVEEEFTDGYEIGPDGKSYVFVTAADKKARDALIK
jgi:hypothetical protein